MNDVELVAADRIRRELTELIATVLVRDRPGNDVELLLAAIDNLDCLTQRWREKQDRV